MNSKRYIYILIIAILLGFLASFFASQSPDGLEKISENLGFSRSASSTPGMFIDYTVSAIAHPSMSKAIAGTFGIIFIIFIFHSLAHVRFDVNFLRKLIKLEKKEK
jgi:hypothetical protein